MFNKGSTGQMSLIGSIKISALLIFSVFTSFSSMANVDIEKPYVRATIPGTSVSSAYMKLHSSYDKAVKLVAVKSTVSERVEIHEHTMADGMMKMRQVESLTIAPKGSVMLQPSGYHIMIFNLSKPLKEGEEIALTLVFDNNTQQLVKVPVHSIKRKKQKAHHHHH